MAGIEVSDEHTERGHDETVSAVMTVNADDYLRYPARQARDARGGSRTPGRQMAPTSTRAVYTAVEQNHTPLSAVRTARDGNINHSALSSSIHTDRSSCAHTS